MIIPNKFFKVKQIFSTNFAGEALEPEKCISELASVLQECANIDVESPAEPKKSRKKNLDQPWFDKECKDTKRKIGSLGKQLKRTPNDTKVTTLRSLSKI